MGKWKLAVLLAVMVVLAIPSGVVFAADAIVTGHTYADRTGIVWTSQNNGYLVYNNNAQTQLEWIKTEDGGQNWSTPVVLQASGAACYPAFSFDVWYDRWTYGITTSKIHIAWIYSTGGTSCASGSGTDAYKTAFIDTSDDSTSTPVQITVGSFSGAPSKAELNIVRTVAGDLFLHGNMTTSSSQQYFGKSTDGGASWSARTKPTDSCILNRSSFVPVRGHATFLTSDADVYVFCTNPSSVTIETHGYQDAVDNWYSGTSWSADELVNSNVENRPDIALNTDTNEVFALVYDEVHEVDATVANVMVFKYQSNAVGNTTWSQVTNCLTDEADFQTADILFDNNEDTLYCVWEDASDTAWYKVSLNEGVSWSDPIEYGTTTGAVAMSRLAVPNNLRTTGGRFMPVWRASGVLETDLSAAALLAPLPAPDEGGFERQVEWALGNFNAADEGGRLFIAMLILSGIALILGKAGVKDVFVFAVVGIAGVVMAMPADPWIPPWAALVAVLIGGLGWLAGTWGGASDG